MKKIAAGLMIIFCCLTFVGCTSATDLSSINTKFSSIYFAIDCSNSGINTMDEAETTVLKNKIQSLATTYIQQIKLRYYNILDNLEASKKISNSEKIIYRNHITPYVGWTENNYLIEFRFYTTTASRLFIKSAEYSGAKNEKGTFSTVTTEKFKSVFSKTPNNLIQTSLEEYFSSGVKSAMDELGETSSNKLNEINYYYLFITQSSKLRARGADEVVRFESGSIFCYYSLENNQEIEFEFYVVQANRLVYYLIALASTFVFIAIYLMVLYFIKLKKSRIKPKIKEFEESDLDKDGFIEIKIKDEDNKKS